MGLGLASALVCVAGLLAELAAGLGWIDPNGSLRSGLSLSYEGNLPTWYAAGLLWTAGLGLGQCGRRHVGPDRLRWFALAGIFMLLSLDEAIELHEHLGGDAQRHGVLYFSWVLPGALLTGSFALAYLGFWRRLPPPTRRDFALAFALFVGGALGMELPLGAWTEVHGDENLVYGVIDFVEESLELAGLSVFLVAIAGHLRALEAAPLETRV